MKEAFWGVLIILLGLFGIVVVNIFQNVTVDNDRVYYLIKESTEASALDAIDITQYRLTGNLRIVEDKFVENLTRRFAENITIGDYTIVVEDINEMPPKVSLRIRSGVTSLAGEKFGIQNRVDGVLETKYSLDEVLEFLGITEDEWNSTSNTVNIEVDSETGENVCKSGILSEEEMECIPGDIMFSGFSSVDMKNAVCQDETIPSNKERTANYKVCNCGKWEEKREIVTANPVRVGNEYVYTWAFNKNGEIRTITETIKQRVEIQVCTTAIGEMVPKDIETKIPDKNGSSYEPSTDNSNYIACPEGGIRIPVGMKYTVHPNYIPKESINRNLEWTVSDDSVLSIQSSNPSNTCELNKNATNCFSKAIVTAKKVGTTTVNIKTTRGQTASCKVEVFDGDVDSVSCSDLTLEYNASGVMKRDYSPKNATNTEFTWSISDSSIATINEKSGAVTAKKSGTATVTITSSNGKSGTCKLKVNTIKKGSYTSNNIGSCQKTVHECIHKDTDYKWVPVKKCDSWEKGDIPGCNPTPSFDCKYNKNCLKYKTEYQYKKDEVRDYDDIDYGGSMWSKTDNSDCRNGKYTITVYKYCRVSRSMNCDNPGMVTDFLISKSSSTHSC